MNIGTANYVITRQIQNSNIPFKYQVNLPRNTPVGLPKAFQRKTNWKYWIKYIKPIWCPQHYAKPNKQWQICSILCCDYAINQSTTLTVSISERIETVWERGPDCQHFRHCQSQLYCDNISQISSLHKIRYKIVHLCLCLYMQMKATIGQIVINQIRNSRVFYPSRNILWMDPLSKWKFSAVISRR